MNRLCQGMAVLVISMVGASCGDPTGDLRGGPHQATADPSSLFLDQGETQNVVVRVVDEQGNELASVVSDIVVSPADLATATIDSSFLAGTDTTGPAQIPEPTRTQLVVTGGARGAGTMTITASGQTLMVPVRVLPVATEFDATFSSQAPALAEQVTVTAPAGFTFTDSSTVSFPGAPNPIVTAVGGSTLTFLPGPNTSGKATITNIVPSYAPTLSLDFTTVDTLATPVIDTIDATFSTTTPASSEPVTITAPAGFTFQPAAAVLVAGTAAIVNSRAVDNTSITFQVAPGTIGPVTIDSVIVSAVPQFPLSLPARDSIVAGPLAPLAGTGSTATAPNFDMPAAGGGLAIFDAPDFSTATHFYRLTVTEAGDYDITVDWDLGSDLDAAVCTDATCTAFAEPANGMATAAHPEHSVYTLAPGTYYLLVQDFAGDAAGAALSVAVLR